MREDRVGRAVHPCFADGCDHQDDLRHRQRAVVVSQRVVAQAAASGCCWRDGIRPRGQRCRRCAVAIDFQAHTGHRIGAQQAAHSVLAGAQHQLSTGVHRLVAGGDAQGCGSDGAIVATDAGGAATQDVVGRLAARQAQVAQRVANVGCAHVGCGELTHARDRQLAVRHHTARQVRSNHTLACRNVGSARNGQAQRNIVHGCGGVVLLAHPRRSRHRHRALRDRGRGAGLVSDAVVADLCT